MRSTLYLKFIIVYIIFGFLSLFTAATLSSVLISRRLEEKVSSSIYKEANLFATDYLPGYFSDTVKTPDVRAQLKGMASYLEAAVWFVTPEGEFICSVDEYANVTAPQDLINFNPTELGSSQYTTGNYHDYFDSDVLTVIVPVTKGFAVKGYLLVHKPLSSIEEQQNTVMSVVYITVIVIFILSFCILLAFHFFIYQPLRKVTEAATQYASGNLEHEIPIRTEDEMGYLSASLNYMARQLNDMEDYQKKFIANVSHDFRSPLTSIKGYITAMADGTIPPQMQEKYLNIILFETERLTDLTRDLLTLNEFDTKDLLLNKASFDLHEMIKNTAASFEGTCTNKKIFIELLFASKALNVFADARKIQQVLYNLLDNAIKFSNSDSTVTIETTIRNDKVFLSVKDRGIGIPKDSITKIWDRFYKTDLSRGKDKKGTGLGLAIVKEIIQAHNENINVISTEGVGTEFIFSLPIAR